MACRWLVSLLRQPRLCRCFSARRQDEATMNVFDRKAKRKQRNRAALAEDVAVYDYLKDEVRRQRHCLFVGYIMPRWGRGQEVHVCPPPQIFASLSKPTKKTKKTKQTTTTTSCCCCCSYESLLQRH